MSKITTGAGFKNSNIIQCTVRNVHMDDWTVDVTSNFDQHSYARVQVGCPYLHYSNGEGIYAMPETGAQCLLAVPGDTSTPCILTFIAPSETRSSTSATDPGGIIFKAGRPDAVPGDIVLRTRDNNFVVLHRGGVLQIGANDLSQRIYIPLGNFITDISGNYHHFNTAGSVLWGIQEGKATENIPAYHTQTFRVYADNQYADIRVSTGKVQDILPNKSDDAVSQLLDDMGFGDVDIVCTVDMALQGFDAATGRPVDDNVAENVLLHYYFENNGNIFMRTEGNILLVVQQAISVLARGDITIHSEQNLALKSDADVSFDGAQMKLNGGDVGSQGIVRKSDTIQVPAGVAFTGSSPTAGTITGTTTAPMTCTIMTASGTVACGD